MEEPTITTAQPCSPYPLNEALRAPRDKVRHTLETIWEKTAGVLTPLGFVLEKTEQPNLRYAVPQHGT